MDAIPRFSQAPLAITFILAGISGAIYLAYRWALPKPLPGIPYDPDHARSLLGSLPDLIANVKSNGRVSTWMTSQNVKHDAPMTQIWLGPLTRPMVILTDFLESQDICLRRAKEFDRAANTIACFTNVIPHHHVSMHSDDPRFKGNKELVRDLMSPAFLHEVNAPQIYSKCSTLIDLWLFKCKVANGAPFEAKDDITDAAFDMINAAVFAFGDDLTFSKRSLDNLASAPNASFSKDANGAVIFPRPPLVPDLDVLMTVAAYLGDSVVAPIPWLWHYYRMLTDSPLRRKIRRKNELIKAQLRTSLERLENGDRVQRSATDFLIQRENAVSQKEHRTPDYYSGRTIDELFGYIVAGHETTSTALAWILKLLSDHQEVQAKLREAIREALPAAIAEGRRPNVMEIIKTKMPYLDAVLEEALRLRAPTPLFVREAMVDTVVLGRKIPKGVNIFITNSGPGFKSPPVKVDDSLLSDSMRAKKVNAAWNPEDISQFRPERWLKRDEKGNTLYDSQAGPFLTFSIGNRGCFGKKLAYLEMRIIVLLLLWTFHFKKLDGELASHDAIEGLTVAPRFCYVGLEKI
ncbi:cytochrome P450 [Xylariales sp. PMI_506]|nr:cytochrome P450 [Xylariales sp. PMI_506]